MAKNTRKMFNKKMYTLHKEYFSEIAAGTRKYKIDLEHPDWKTEIYQRVTGLKYELYVRKPSTPKERKAALREGMKEIAQGGVTWLANKHNTVARFKSWSDASTPGGGLHQHHIYQGVPFTQEELDMHYPELKRYTVLTKAKIGSAKVAFKDVKTPLAVQYNGYTYVVAPDIAQNRPGQQVPESMTKPKLTAPPELAADLLGGLTPTATPGHKPAARTTKPKAKKTPTPFYTLVSEIPTGDKQL